MARRAKLGKLANDAHAAREELMTVLASIEALAGEPEYLPELGEAAAAAYGAISKAPLAPLLLRIHNLPGPLG